MSYIGKNPKVDELRYTPQSSDPTNPTEGEVFRSDGTSRAKGLWEYIDGDWQKIGSEANAAVFYINEDFEGGVQNLVAYQDAAGTSPVDGTGGSPTVTVTEDKVNPLVGTASAAITKDAANRQGEGAAILSATVDEAYEDKVHTVQFQWKTDANYTDGDMSLWVIAPTTGTVEPLYFRTALGEYTNELPAASDSVTTILSELTPIDDTYRVVLHVGSTTATAFEVLVDNIQAGPQRGFNVPLITEWQSYTPTIQGCGTVSAVDFKYRRVGSSIEVGGRFTTGTPTATTFFVDLPTGLTISSDQASIAAGQIRQQNNTITTMHSYALGGETTIAASRDEIVGALDRQNGSALFVASESVTLTFSARIEGWDAGAAFSTTQVDQKSAVVEGAGNAGTVLTPAVTNIDFTETQDNLNAWDGAIFTAPTAMRVILKGQVRFTAAYSGDIQTYVNGIASKAIGFGTGASGSVQIDAYQDLAAGDQLSLRASTGATLSIDTLRHWVAIQSIVDISAFGTFPEKNLLQTKVLSADVTSAGTVADLTFSNLIVGKWYDIKGQIYMAVNDGAVDTTLILEHIHNATTIYRNIIQLQNGTSSQDLFMQQVNYSFQAEATSITFNAVSATATSYFRGANDRTETYLQIEERNNLRETDKF